MVDGNRERIWNGSEIAIVGMAGGFPGARDLDTFWSNLRNGVDSVSEFSEEELDATFAVGHRTGAAGFVPRTGVLEDAEMFDPRYFGIFPREAEMFDPQQRQFLQCAVSALQHAGYDPNAYDGSIGVFAGAGPATYLFNVVSQVDRALSGGNVVEAVLGNDSDFVPTRTAFTLDLHGPSMNIQSGGSTSLACVHLASESLRTFQCDVAIAGGVSIKNPQRAGYTYSGDGPLSPTGVCRAFDAGADGYVPANAVAIVVLRRLEDAIADGDTIHAVVLGSAVNSDGNDKQGFFDVSSAAQLAVMREALANADVDPDTISYVEADGSSCPERDEAEFEALTRAFRSSTDREGFCALGSVKTNIGHADAASGVTGLIKTVLALDHEEIPPSLHFERANPRLDIESSPFFMNTTLRPWKREPEPRRAGVSSFGIGGSNAHVVVEEAPLAGPSGPAGQQSLLVLSALTESALATAGEELAAHLRAHPDLCLADVAYTLQQGRRELPHRRTLVCGHLGEAAHALESAVGATSPVRTAVPVAFVFSETALPSGRTLGQLVRCQPGFGEHLDAGLERLVAVLEPGDAADDLRDPGALRELLLGDDPQRPPVLCSALRLVVQNALARTWLDLGVVPEALLGEGRGEWGAACLAGTLPLDASLRLVLASEREGSDEERDAALRSVLEAADLREPAIDLVSGATGGWIAAERATDARTWLAALDPAPRRSEALRELRGDGERILLELAAGSSLETVARDVAPESAERTLRCALPEERGEGTGSVERHVLETLGHLWSTGVEVEWGALSRHEQRHRIPLPTYPFEQERYFIQPTPEHAAAVRLNMLQPIDPDRDHWFYAPSWLRRELASSRGSRSPGGQRERWLVFAGPDRVGPELASRWEAQGGEAILVRSGSEFRRLEDGSFELDPGEREHYEALFQELTAEERRPHRIVQLGYLDPDPPGELDLATADRAERIFLELLYLAQGIERSGLAESWLKLSVVTNGLYSVTGSEALRPETATVLGACTNLPHEFLHTDAQAIDVELPARGEPLDAVVDQILSEAGSDASEPVAYRSGRRWVQSFERVPHPEVDLADAPVHDEGVYLVTGGTRGIGLELARYLAGAASRVKLVLLSRSPFPPRETWDEVCAEAEPGDQARQSIEKIRHIETLGAEILLVNADVGSEEEFEAALDRAYERFGTLDGVIHSAGIPGGGLIAMRTPEQARAVLAPKLRGTVILASSLARRGTHPDFFVVCSSISSMLGVPGDCDYCAANAFLDAFADYNSIERGVFTLAINWETWKEVGMAADAARHRSLQMMHEMARQEGYRNDEGIDAFHRVLTQASLPRIMVLKRGLEAVIQSSDVFYSMEGLMASQRLSTTYARPDLTTDYVPPTSDFEARIAKLWERSLGYDRVGIHDDFFELGGQSLFATSLVAQLMDELDCEVPVGTLYRAPTVAGLSALCPGADDARLSPLVSIRPHGGRPPIFCFHPAGGEIAPYQALARYLPVDQPVFAIRSRALHAPAQEHDSVDAMLEEYVSTIRECRPQGPYILLGWGIGATLAQLAAARLEDGGGDVGLVALWDPPRASAEPDAAANLAAALGWTLGRALDELDPESREALLSELATLGADERESRLGEWARDPERFAGDVLPEVLERLASLASKHVALLEGVTLPRIGANVHAIAPTGGGDDASFATWQRATLGRFAVDRVNVDPDGHLLESSLDEVVELLKVHLFSAQGLGGFA